MVNGERRGIFASLSSVLKGGNREAKSPIRPPYNTDSDLFHRLCPDCTDKQCIKVCEEEIITIGKDGTPVLTFSSRGCTFCDECLKACELGVLSDKTVNFINAEVEIDVLKCMAWHQTICSSCKDPCLENAINFLGLFRPSIDLQNCTACGWCIPVCPVDAVNIVSMHKD